MPKLNFQEAITPVFSVIWSFRMNSFGTQKTWIIMNVENSHAAFI